MGRRLQKWGHTGQQCRRTEVNKLRRHVAIRRSNLERNSGLYAIYSIECPSTGHRVQETSLIEPPFAPAEWEFVTVGNVQHLRNIFDREGSIAGALERRKVCRI